jgi:hypothetical protein
MPWRKEIPKCPSFCRRYLGVCALPHTVEGMQVPIADRHATVCATPHRQFSFEPLKMSVRLPSF